MEMELKYPILWLNKPHSYLGWCYDAVICKLNVHGICETPKKPSTRAIFISWFVWIESDPIPYLMWESNESENM